ncbi:hypothetical protein L1887_62515 [Cichorium endivia]|nr:hypothetical protein L1887_62515 [Cichorium endivia]
MKKIKARSSSRAKHAKSHIAHISPPCTASLRDHTVDAIPSSHSLKEPQHDRQRRRRLMRVIAAVQSGYTKRVRARARVSITSRRPDLDGEIDARGGYDIDGPWFLLDRIGSVCTRGSVGVLSRWNGRLDLGFAPGDAGAEMRMGIDLVERCGSLGGRCGGEFFLELRHARFHLHDLLLEPDDARPLLLEQACVFGLGIGHKAVLPRLAHEGCVGFVQTVGLEVVEDRLVQFVLLALGEHAGAADGAHGGLEGRPAAR